MRAARETINAEGRDYIVICNIGESCFFISFFLCIFGCSFKLCAADDHRKSRLSSKGLLQNCIVGHLAGIRALNLQADTHQGFTKSSFRGSVDHLVFDFSIIG